MEHDDVHGAGISRRSVLKSAAVGGAVVWAAPVITSLTAPAVAEGSPGCTSTSCTEIRTSQGVLIGYLRCEPLDGYQGCPCLCAGQPTNDPCGSPQPCIAPFACSFVDSCP